MGETQKRRKDFEMKKHIVLTLADGTIREVKNEDYTKELFNKYLGMLNKAELRKAIALERGLDEVVKKNEEKISCFVMFLSDIAEQIDTILAHELVEESYMGTTANYYKTIAI